MKKATENIVDPEFGDMPTSKLGLIDLIRIPTEIDIVLRNTTARKHELEGLVKSMKKPEQEMLDAEVSKLGMGLNMFGKSEVDVLQQSKSALSNAAGVLNASNDIAQTIPNVRALLPEDEEDNDNDEEEEAEGSEQGSDPENATSKKPKGKKGQANEGEEEDKWWPREAFCLEKERELEALVETQRKAVEEERDKLKKYYEAIGLYVDVKSVCLACKQF